MRIERSRAPLPDKDIGRIYRLVQGAPLSLSARQFAILVGKCRHDPRLCEVLTEHIRDYWWK
jgi:hypothetical protein